MWAPTAQRVQLLLFDSPRGGEPVVHAMQRNGKGAWQTDRPQAWAGKYYLYRCDHSGDNACAFLMLDDDCVHMLYACKFAL